MNTPRPSDVAHGNDHCVLIFADRSGWDTWQPQTEEAKQAAQTRVRFTRAYVTGANLEYVTAYVKRGLVDFLRDMGHEVEVELTIKRRVGAPA